MPACTQTLSRVNHLRYSPYHDNVELPATSYNIPLTSPEPPGMRLESSSLYAQVAHLTAQSPLQTSSDFPGEKTGIRNSYQTAYAEAAKAPCYAVESQSSFFQKDNQHSISQACQGFSRVCPDLMIPEETWSAYSATASTSRSHPTVADSSSTGSFLSSFHTIHNTPSPVSPTRLGLSTQSSIPTSHQFVRSASLSEATPSKGKQTRPHKKHCARRRLGCLFTAIQGDLTRHEIFSCKRRTQAERKYAETLKHTCRICGASSQRLSELVKHFRERHPGADNPPQLLRPNCRSQQS